MLGSMTVLLATTCEECLDRNGFKTHFWCTTRQACLPLGQKDECLNAEWHDLVLNASRCCSTIGSQEECISL